MSLIRSAFSNHFPNRVYNPTKLVDYVYNILEPPDKNHMIVLAFMGDVPVGFISFMLVEDHFSDTKIAVENHWYVLPEYRASSAGLRLLNAFEYWAQHIVNADEILVSSGRTTSLGALLERRKYTPFMNTARKILT